MEDPSARTAASSPHARGRRAGQHPYNHRDCLPVADATCVPSTATPCLHPAQPPSAPTPTPLIHIVKSGETLLVIAASYGADLDRLMEANDLDQELARRLRVGQELIVPDTAGVGGPLPADNPPPRQIVHSVQAGDTLISIAAQYDADWTRSWPPIRTSTRT